MPTNISLKYYEKQLINESIATFGNGGLTSCALKLFGTLGYNTTRRLPLPEKTSKYFIEHFTKQSRFINENALTNEWKSIDLLFQLTNNEITTNSKSIKQSQFKNQIIESYLFIAIDLIQDDYSRTKIAQITREINKVFVMPIFIVFRYGTKITLAIINRKINKQDHKNDIPEKVILIKDISITNTHPAHLGILYDLSLQQISRKIQIRNFIELNNSWMQILDTKELHKRFYKELSDWYFWAVKHVKFPNDKKINTEIRNSTNLIRLITRIIFVWFLKEKELIPEKLFDQNELKTIIKNFNRNEKSTNYYNAILQNLFFATLNQKTQDRKFAEENDFMSNRNEYSIKTGIKTHYRYVNMFSAEKTEAQKLFKQIPFLNSGLFDCLDKENPETNKIEYVDGFNHNPKNRAIIPDFLFFGEKQKIDLNTIYNTHGKIYEVKGLFNILRNYKFTVTENTPIEEDIALDPELLGKTFENLLASYNPETKTTARKQTGSFYTPREIVDYMVDESLISYLKNYILSKQYRADFFDSPQSGLFRNKNKKKQLKLERKLNQRTNNKQELENKLRSLLSYETNNPFNEHETITIIQAIDSCSILDPACGSGAFPMGILHKIVLILQKLDPENKYWKKQQQEQIIRQKILELQNNTKLAAQLNNVQIRKHAEKKVENSLQQINEIFDRKFNSDDYARKFFSIKNCIFGVDIQPIAIQIVKLRFFISLIADQHADKTKKNYGIRVLPNLEMKFVAANTLIGLDSSQQLMLHNSDIEKKEQKLKANRCEYFSADNRIKKKKLQENNKQLRRETAELLKKYGWDNTAAEQIVSFDFFDSNTHAEWFDPEWMFGMTQGFDIVIGNPPYIEISKKEQKIIFQEKYKEVLSGHYDLYIFFFKKGIDLLKNGGVNVFITPHTFTQYKQFINLRKWLYKNVNILEITDRIESVFESAVVDNSISVLSKNNFQPHTNFTKYIYENSKLKKISSTQLKKKEYNSDSFDIKSIKNKKILKRFYSNSICLNEFVESCQGITVYAKLQGEKINYFRKNYINNSSKKCTRGREIFKYNLQWSKTYIEYGEWLWCPRNCKFFELPKIFIRQTSADIIATYIEEPFYCIDSVHSLIQKNKNIDLKYILGILNSKLGNYFYHLLISETGKIFAQVKLNFLRQIPIKDISTTEQQPIITLVDQILSAKKKNPSVDTSSLEAEIDDIVFHLYELTESEKKSVLAVSG
ncbi:MAG: Eco57I restriction-modification methylase domain-containing protein [Planctomycetaceae bacterium]|jgi:hypothetical protein|nr:Eco57I restriction-modification methylase domain-containing protein [Planctomycetaceae bacterium]